MSRPLNIFYQEPDPDRWIKFDRYPRSIVRRIIRGKAKPGGVMMVALNLMKGLDKLSIPYRFNDFKYIKKHPHEIACIIGKPNVLFDNKWHNPIIFGAGIYSHPIECPDLLSLYPNIKRVLVPGDWMKAMFEPYYNDKVTSWPTGIDTETWKPSVNTKKEFDFLIYDKIRWEHSEYEDTLIKPILAILDKKGLKYTSIRYGQYDHKQLQQLLAISKAAIFLCEHETQGLAYQQILSAGLPIVAWDRGSYWQDPAYYPHKVKFKPVSSVPYWDERCGVKFVSADDFEDALAQFQNHLQKFKPREFITKNLSLEVCAHKYMDIYRQV